MNVTVIVSIYALPFGGYAFYDKIAKSYRFAQVPTGIEHEFTVMDFVPSDWRKTGPVAKGKLRVHFGKQEITYNFPQIDFFQGQKICPYCYRPLDDCDCCDTDVCPDMGAKG